MDRPELAEALIKYECALKVVQESRVDVWMALALAEPQLAAEILLLFSSIDRAAAWVTSPSDDYGNSPAHCIANGRAEQVAAMVERTANGFVG